MFIYLSKGWIIFRYDQEGTKDKEKKFRQTEQKKAANWLYRTFGTVPQGHMSSSCDFPHEAGFKRSFDVRKWVQEIHEDLLNRRAITIPENLSLEAGTKVLKALLGQSVIYPLKLNFPGGREIVFANDSVYTLFWNGFFVGSNWNKFTDPKTVTKKGARKVRRG